MITKSRNSFNNWTQLNKVQTNSKASGMEKPSKFIRTMLLSAIFSSSMAAVNSPPMVLPLLLNKRLLMKVQLLVKQSKNSKLPSPNVPPQVMIKARVLFSSVVPVWKVDSSKCWSWLLDLKAPQVNSTNKFLMMITMSKLHCKSNSISLWLKSENWVSELQFWCL